MCKCVCVCVPDRHQCVCERKNASPSIECESVSCSSFHIFVLFTHFKQIQMHLSAFVRCCETGDGGFSAFFFLYHLSCLVHSVQPYQLVALTAIVFHILTVSVMHSLTQRHATKLHCVVSHRHCIFSVRWVCSVNGPKGALLGVHCTLHTNESIIRSRILECCRKRIMSE